MDFKEFMINEYGEPLAEVEARCAAVDRNIAALKSRVFVLPETAPKVGDILMQSGSFQTDGQVAFEWSAPLNED